MNQQAIDLYTKLSKTRIYRERFLPIKAGDVVYYERIGCGVVVKKYSVRASIILDILSLKLAEILSFLGDDDSLIWFPPVFDPDNPERCLWGMVDALRKRIITEKDGRTRVCITFEEMVSDKTYNADRLDLALIKAILKQEKSHVRSK